MPGAGSDNEINFKTNQVGCKVRQPFEFPFCKSVLDDNIFPFDIAKLAQPLAECFETGYRKQDAEPSRISYAENSPVCCARRRSREQEITMTDKKMRISF